MEQIRRRRQWLPVLLGTGLIFLLVISVFLGKGVYVRLLPESRALAAFPVPPGRIAGTERLRAGRTSSPGWSSSYRWSSREYEVNGSAADVLSFFRTSLQQQGWGVGAEYHSSPMHGSGSRYVYSAALDLVKMDLYCGKVMVPDEVEGRVRVLLTLREFSNDCLE